VESGVRVSAVGVSVGVKQKFLRVLNHWAIHEELGSCSAVFQLVVHYDGKVMASSEPGRTVIVSKGSLRHVLGRDKLSRPRKHDLR
jgi:hypothetical protein